MKGEHTRAACLASAASDLWANHAMIALVEQQQRRHAEYLAAHYTTDERNGDRL